MKTESKRQDLPIRAGTLPRGLWVVATPIGNLGDASPRVRAALAEADTLLCEDTRVTARLLSALGVVADPERKLLRLDAHSRDGLLERLVKRLEAGESFALVADAGTPALSDPGAALVRMAVEAGITITPVPGPSALTTLYSVLGFPETEFSFLGFFPRETKERTEALAAAARSELSRVAIWFESPHRIGEALAAVATGFPAAEVVAAKELTKLHERFFRGLAPQAADQVGHELSREGPLGEWVFGVRFPAPAETSAIAADDKSSDWVKALRCLHDAGVSASEAAKRVSQHFGVAKNLAYEKSLAVAGKKKGGGD